MKALLNGKGDNNSYISSTITLFAITDQYTIEQHFKWMGFLQQFHLVIKYTKGIHNEVADMLSRKMINASTIVRIICFLMKVMLKNIQVMMILRMHIWI